MSFLRRFLNRNTAQVVEETGWKLNLSRLDPPAPPPPAQPRARDNTYPKGAVALPPPNWVAIRSAWPKMPNISGIAWMSDGRFKIDVVGESHYVAALEQILTTRGTARESYQEVKAPCVLVREPDNPHDPNAVAVQVDGWKVGYIPRENAANLARRIDSIGAHPAGVATLRGRPGGPIGVTVGIRLQ